MHVVCLGHGEYKTGDMGRDRSECIRGTVAENTSCGLRGHARGHFPTHGYCASHGIKARYLVEQQAQHSFCFANPLAQAVGSFPHEKGHVLASLDTSQTVC